MDQKTSENGLFLRRTVPTLPLGFTDVFDRKVPFRTAKNAFLHPRSQSKGPNHALEKYRRRRRQDRLRSKKAEHLVLKPWFDIINPMDCNRGFSTSKRLVQRSQPPTKRTRIKHTRTLPMCAARTQQSKASAQRGTKHAKQKCDAGATSWMNMAFTHRKNRCIPNENSQSHTRGTRALFHRTCISQHELNPNAQCPTPSNHHVGTTDVSAEAKMFSLIHRLPRCQPKQDYCHVHLNTFSTKRNEI